MDFTENCKISLIKVLFCFCFFYSEVHYFFFSIFCAKNVLFDRAAETHLQQRHTWLESSAHLAVHINLIFTLLPVWPVWICHAVETSFCLCVLGVVQFNLWSFCFNCFFGGVLLLHVCLPTTKEEKHTKNQCATVNSLTRFPSWNVDTFNLNHTWTRSNHRDTTPFDFKCSLCF